MKIERPENHPAEKNAPRKRLSFGGIFKHWYVLAILLVGVVIISFVAGAAVYRIGVFRPVTAWGRRALAQGPLAVFRLGGPVGETSKNLADEVRMYEVNGLPTLYIDMPFKNYQKILDKRNEALKTRVLQTTDADFVNAKMHLQDGPSLAVQMRLKGDWTDHLEGNKWSYRIKLKDDGSILHFRQFNIQSPETRNYLNEWGFHQNLIKEGILTTRYDFINVLLNGKLLGTYAIEEFFAPELIESQGRRQGVIIRYDENLLWDNTANFWGNGLHQEGNFMVTNADSADIAPFGEARVAKNPTLEAEAETARNLLRAFQSGERPASEVFDVDQMGRFYALSDLWSACHGVYWHNMRFFYNPITGKLEPVAYDSEPMRWCDKDNTIINEFIKTNTTKIFDDPEIRAAYARELKRVTQPDYVKQLKNDLVKQHDSYLSALKVEYPGDEAGIYWEQLVRRAKSLALELKPAQPVRGSFQLENALPESTGQPALNVDLINLMLLPVEVARIELNGKVMPMAQKTILAPVHDRDNSVFTPVRVAIPLASKDGLDPTTDKVDVVVRLQGLEDEFTIPILGGKMPDSLKVGPLPQQPSVDEVLHEFAFLSKPTADPVLVVSSGVWDVPGDLILPDGMDLLVSPGTALRFNKDKILYSTGAINLNGTPDAPVILTSQQDGWGGVVVLNAKRESVWKYALIEKMVSDDRNGITRGGWVQTGGVNIIKSKITLQHSRLGNNLTEDGINVVHGVFSFQDSEFFNTFSDAFDSDFSTGEVVRSYFHDVGADGIDVSGTKVKIIDTRVEHSKDKGISAGEASDVIVQGSTFIDNRMGICSKDLSKVVASDSLIQSARYAGLAAYIKKPVYGPATIVATNVKIQDTKVIAVAQTGNTIIIDGKPVETVELDVAAGYAQGILGN